MRSYLDFEKPVGRARGRRSRNCAPCRRAATSSASPTRSSRLEAKAAQTLADLYAKLTPWQKTQVARHPHAAALPRLHRRADHRLHAARRRPQVRRRRGDRRRLRPLPRRERLRHRPGEGLDHREPAQAQFRHGAAGGLPQGRAADGDGRPLRHSGARAGRHRRRLSRHRRRGARPGRGDRALDRGLPRCSACRTSR